MLSPRWRKVLRDLWDNRTRTLMVVLSITIGLSAFGSLLAARANLLGNLTIDYTTSNPADIVLQTLPFDAEAIAWMTRQPYVTGAQAAAPREAHVLLNEDTRLDITLIAYADAPTIHRLRPHSGGTVPADGEIVLERGFSPTLPFITGESLTLETEQGTHTLAITGLVYDANVQSGLISSRLTGYVTQATLEQTGLRSVFSQMLVTVDRDRMAQDGITLQQVADTLRDGLVGQGVRTFAVTLNESQRHWAASTVGGLVLILVMVGMLSLIFSSFLIVTIISGFLAAQRRQIGIMKIVGATRGAIIRLYLVMVIAFGLLALLISLPLSTLVADAFVTVISTTLNLNITQTGLPPSVVVLQILIASGIPMLAALIPILNATGVPPARAIRDEGVPRTGIVERALARLSVLPRPYLLALRGIFRNRGRLVLTTMTLILAGALFMSIWNIRASVPAAIASSLRMSDFDAQILFARSVSQNDVETAALETAGIEAAEGWLNTRARYILPSGQQGGEVVVNGLRHNSVFVNAQPVEGRWLQTPTPENAGDMVITGNLALAEQLSVGDTVTLLIDEQEHRFTVVGIVESLLAAAFIDYDALGDMMGLEGRATLVQVRTTDASLQGERAAADALREAFEARGWFVITARSQQDFIGGAVGGFNIVITLLLSLALMVALVGGLGLAGAISLNVLERVREIGVMRSIGAGTALLMRMFVLEGVFIGVLSAVFALIISFPFSRVFAMALGTALGQGQFSAVFSPSGVLLWLGIVVVVSAAASLLPALRGSRITIREALAYE